MIYNKYNCTHLAKIYYDKIYFKKFKENYSFISLRR